MTSAPTPGPPPPPRTASAARAARRRAAPAPWIAAPSDVRATRNVGKIGTPCASSRLRCRAPPRRSSSGLARGDGVGRGHDAVSASFSPSGTGLAADRTFPSLRHGSPAATVVRREHALATASRRRLGASTHERHDRSPERRRRAQRRRADLARPRRGRRCLRRAVQPARRRRQPAGPPAGPRPRRRRPGLRGVRQGAHRAPGRRRPGRRVPRLPADRRTPAARRPDPRPGSGCRPPTT